MVTIQESNFPGQDAYLPHNYEAWFALMERAATFGYEVIGSPEFAGQVADDVRYVLEDPGWRSPKEVSLYGHQFRIC